MCPRQAPEASGPALLTVRIQPRASRNEVVIQEDGTVKIRLMAPPVDGAANEALVRFLADTLAVPKTDIGIVSGHTSRTKIVRIEGLSAEEANGLLNEKGK